MPELPDITVYCEALGRRVVGTRLLKVRIFSPFALRSVSPPISDLEGRTVRAVERLGKRIAICLEGDLYLVIHLMIAGRLGWKTGPSTGARPSGRIGLASFEFESGTLSLTEAGTKKWASIYAVAGIDGLEPHRRGGLEVLTATEDEFVGTLRRENRTLKRALTNPANFSGIGNAYSDEILHAARLSPMRLTQALTTEESRRLFQTTRTTLAEWTDRLRLQFEDKFPGPGQITAFRPDFAVHGKFGQPCPVCGSPVQRIRYAENETNYCARCQNEGRLLADRALSRLLKSDWPRTLEEMVGG